MNNCTLNNIILNRLFIIQLINKPWFKQIVEFLEVHPEFLRLMPIVALDEFPRGFNMNPYENDDTQPRDLFETVLHGIASCDGVKPDTAKRQFVKIAKYYREGNPFSVDMVFPFKIGKKKLTAYRKVINVLLNNGVDLRKMTVDDIDPLDQQDLITYGTITLVYLLYADVNDDRVVPYYDAKFVKGLMAFYGIEDMPTLSQVKEITASWQNKKVGVMFAIQYAHYSKYIDEPEESNKIAEITFTLNADNKIEDINTIQYIKPDEDYYQENYKDENEYDQEEIKNIILHSHIHDHDNEPEK